MRQRRAFYLETLVLVALLVAVILTVTVCFARAENTRQEARLLTGAVELAKNAAEAAAEAADETQLAHILTENNNCVREKEGLTLRYDGDFQPDPAGEIFLKITWQAAENGLVTYDISVEKDRALYALETAVYRGGNGG